jgi:integrase
MLGGELSVLQAPMFDGLLLDPFALFDDDRSPAEVGIGAHSLRRTKASLIYKATGNLRPVQILLGHTNIENTVRYLGVDIDDALTLSERTEI